MVCYGRACRQRSEPSSKERRCPSSSTTPSSGCATRGSATFLAELLGVAPPTPFGPFLVVQVDNDVSLDFADDHGPVHPQHYAFLVGEDEFDQIFGRIRERGCPSGPTRAGAGRVRSTPTTAAAASTGRTERPLPGDHHRPYGSGG